MSPKHVHACPKCHERPVCTMGCALVPDLGTTPDLAATLVDLFTDNLVAEGFNPHTDVELHAALAHVRGLLTTHHERMAKARADLDAAIRGPSPTLVFEAPHGSLTLAHLHRGEDR